MSRSLILLFIAAPAALLVACGSDTGTGTTGTSTEGTTTTGTGGAGGSATTTSSTSSGGGAGGEAATTATGTSTSTATGTSTGSSSSSSSGSSSSASSTGSGAMGACTNASDGAILMSKDAKKITTDCGKTNVGQEPATKNCIKMGTGLSDPCVTCFDNLIQCVVSKCLNQCFSDPNSAACTTCRKQNCDPAFEMCSGLPAT